MNTAANKKVVSLLLAFGLVCSALSIPMEAAGKAMKIYADALNGDVRGFIEGNVIKPVFRKYN